MTHTDLLISGLSATIAGMRDEVQQLRALAQDYGDRAATFKVMLSQAWDHIHRLETRERRRGESYRRLVEENRRLRADASRASQRAA